MFSSSDSFSRGAQALSLNEFTGKNHEYNGKSCAGATAAELTMLAHLYRGEMYTLATAGTRRWLFLTEEMESAVARRAR